MMKSIFLGMVFLLQTTAYAKGLCPGLESARQHFHAIDAAYWDGKLDAQEYQSALEVNQNSVHSIVLMCIGAGNTDGITKAEFLNVHGRLMRTLAQDIAVFDSLIEKALEQNKMETARQWQELRKRKIHRSREISEQFQDLIRRAS